MMVFMIGSVLHQAINRIRNLAAQSGDRAAVLRLFQLRIQRIHRSLNLHKVFVDFIESLLHRPVNGVEVLLEQSVDVPLSRAPACVFVLVCSW